MTKKMSPGTMSRNRYLARSRRRRCLCQGVRSIVTGAAGAVPKMSDSEEYARGSACHRTGAQLPPPSAAASITSRLVATSPARTGRGVACLTRAPAWGRGIERATTTGGNRHTAAARVALNDGGELSVEELSERVSRALEQHYRIALRTRPSGGGVGTDGR